MKTTLYIMLAGMLLAGCTEKVTFSEVKVKDKYSVSIPSYLEVTKEMGDIASLQYVNHKDEIYVMGIDENTSDLAKNGFNSIQKYYEHVVQQITDGMEAGAKVSTPVEKSVNGKKSLYSTISGRFNIHGGMHDAYYVMQVVQDSINSLQVVAWNMDHHEDKYGADLNKILESIKF